MIDSLELDIAWGGYYARQNETSGHYAVFRLLDFDRNAYQAALFKERFAAPPTLEDVLALMPYIGHVPIDSRSLLREGALTLLGSRPLTREDLAGYAYYLEEFDTPPEEVDELFERIIGFSLEPPYRALLQLVDDELTVDEC